MSIDLSYHILIYWILLVNSCKFIVFQALFSVLISSQPLGQHAIRGLDTNHYSTFSPLHRVTPMLVSVSTLLWSKSGHCRLGEDDGGDGASSVELQDMSSPSVNAVDQQKLDEFLQLKYQNLMDEFQVLLVADEASLEVVEEATRDIMASYPQPPTDISEEEHLRELQGLVLEFGDWKLRDSRDRQHMLISRFRTSASEFGMQWKDVQGSFVALFGEWAGESGIAWSFSPICFELEVHSSGFESLEIALWRQTQHRNGWWYFLAQNEFWTSVSKRLFWSPLKVT